MTETDLGDNVSLPQVQRGQLYMAVLFWYLVKRDLSSVRVYSSVHWTSHFLQGNRNTRPCTTGHPLYKKYAVRKNKFKIKFKKKTLIAWHNWGFSLLAPFCFDLSPRFISIYSFLYAWHVKVIFLMHTFINLNIKGIK